MSVWGRWGWTRRGFVALSVAAFVYAVAVVVLGLVQADFDRRTFMVGREEVVELEAGESRNVYLTAEESGPWNFDFYPSDLTCTATAPDGEVIEDSELSDERRLLDARRVHWGVASFTAPASGRYELLCRDRSDRSYPLLLAAPSRYGPYDVSPAFGLFVLIVSVSVLGIITLTGSSRNDARGRGGSAAH